MSEIVSTVAPAPRAAVVKMKEYHPPLGDRGGLRLDFNENALECSPAVVRALREISAADLTKYPEREPAERLVAGHLGLQPEQVLLTNGVDEAIHVVCQAYLDAGDEVLFPVPTYSMYEVYASATPARVVAVLANENFEFPYDPLLKAITQATKLIAIANPNSPTGSAASRDQIVRILESAPQAMVLVDEAYFHFFGETVADLIGRYPNLLLARTFSKAYGLAGLRLGALAGHADAMKWLRRVISPYSVNSLALACLPAALGDQEYLDWYVREVLTARVELTSALEALKVKFWASQANFVLAEIGEKHGEFTAAMRQRGVLVRDRSNDPGCDGCVRITVGTGTQTEAGIAAMVESLQEIGWKSEAVDNVAGEELV